MHKYKVLNRLSVKLQGNFKFDFFPSRFKTKTKGYLKIKKKTVK